MLLDADEKNPALGGMIWDGPAVPGAKGLWNDGDAVHLEPGANFPGLRVGSHYRFRIGPGAGHSDCALDEFGAGAFVRTRIGLSWLATSGEDRDAGEASLHDLQSGRIPILELHLRTSLS